MINVVKRNGKKEPYDISKIRKVVNWACEGLDVNPLQLESSLTTVLFDGIKTKDIHDNLIHQAKTFISLEEPDWRYVAGKLLMQNVWKQAFLTRGGICYGDCDNYINFLKMMVFQGRYEDIFEFITEEEIKEIYSSVNFDIKRDFLYDYAGTQQLQKKYLMESELPQEMYFTVTLYLGKQLEKMLGLKLYKEIYDALSLMKVSLATPILINLRRKNGNLSSCFTLALNDSWESISNNIKRAGEISKNGGGLGVCFSQIRAKGSMIQGIYGCSNGVTPWIKLFNDTANACNQLNARKGAFTVALDVWHYDILEFLEIGTEIGDLRFKSFDVFPQVILNDIFMRKVKAKEEWYVFCPHEVKELYNVDLPNLWGKEFEEAYDFLVSKVDNLKVVQKLNAFNIFKRIMQVQIETGLPYLTFKDAINKYNPNKDSGLIRNANLCVAPETRVYTKEGDYSIIELVGKEVEIWNGYEWSLVKPRKTAENQRLYRVIVKLEWSTGDVTYESIDCTSYHNWFVVESDGKEPSYDFTESKKVKTTSLEPTSHFIPKYNFPPLDYQEGYVLKGTILDIRNTERFSDVYCFEEPKRNSVVFNDILTSQCVESYSTTKADEEIHVCNLSALNLANITDIKDIEHYTKIATWCLDALIELTKVPTELGRYHNEKYRTIGVGILGLADHLAYNKYNFTTGKEYIGELFEEFGYAATKASMELCKLGLAPFKAYEDSTWAKGELICKPLSWYRNNATSYLRWEVLADDIQKYGIRNSQITALMPTTSTSLLQGCTAAFLPPYEIFIDDESTNVAPVMPKYVKQRFNYYQANLRFNQRELVDIVATKIQPWIDTGISFELCFDLNSPEFNAPLLRDCIFDAWEKEIKTIYYIRTKAIEEAACESCAS